VAQALATAGALGCRARARDRTTNAPTIQPAAALDGEVQRLKWWCGPVAVATIIGVDVAAVRDVIRR